jgi:CheY-like chemotaxis protein
MVEPEFIIVTAYVTQTFAEHAKRDGANQVFEKPLQKQVLEQIIVYC